MKKLENEARRMCRHTIVYTDKQDAECAALAMMGLTTKAIAIHLRMTESKVQYRIKKSQDSVEARFRNDYRNCNSAFAYRMHNTIKQMAMTRVRQTIAPKFIPLAKKGQINP